MPAKKATPEKDTAPAKAAPSKSADAGEAAVQAAYDEAHAKGYFGTSTDPTPNENYTLAGVIEGKPTPETQFDAAVEALKVRTTGAEGVQPPTK